MADEKKGPRTELIVFASLAAVLLVGVVILIALPGRKPPQTSTSATASASSSAPKAAMPTWTPPNFEDPDASPPLPSNDAPVVVASTTPIVMSSGNVPTMGKGQDTDDVFPLEAKTVQETVTRYSPRLTTLCPADKPQKVVMLVKIQPDGWVDKATVQETDGAQSVADCVAKQIQRWHFKSSTWGGTASIPVVIGK
jgi:hypothetical protein